MVKDALVPTGGFGNDRDIYKAIVNDAGGE